MNAAATETERARLRMGLERLRALKHAGQLHAMHAQERAAERLSVADLATTPAIAGMSRGERAADRERAIIRRRDSLRAARTWPLTGDALADACGDACIAARVPAEHCADVAQSIALHVIRRHGPEPLAADVGASWLRQCAQAFYLKERERSERATGARAAAAELASWQSADRDRAKQERAADAVASGDPVALMADRATLQAPEMVTLDRIIAAIRPALTPGQVSAVWLALDTDHRMHALTSTERVQWSNARKVLRIAFPTVEALRIAYARPEHLARQLVERAQWHAAKLAKVNSRGGGCMIARVPNVFPSLYRTPISIAPTASVPIRREPTHYGPAAIRLARQVRSGADVVAYLARQDRRNGLNELAA